VLGIYLPLNRALFYTLGFGFAHLPIAMQPQAIIPFAKRGLTGLLLIATGLLLCFVFNAHSQWPAEVKKPAFPVSLVLLLAGANLLSSYVQQRPFKAMKNELMASVGMVAAFLVAGWLGAL